MGKDHAIAGDVSSTSDTQFANLARSAIVRSRTNPRTHFDDAWIQELATSIRDHGIAQPLLVRPLPADRLQDTFEDRHPGEALPTHEIVCGECRYRAAGVAGLEAVPVMIRQLTDVQVLQIQLVENLKRKDLHPLEEAEGFQALIEKHGLTVEDIAAKVDKSASQIYVTLKLLDLTPACREELYKGSLTRSLALLVARAPQELQARIAKDIMSPPGYYGKGEPEPMSYRQARLHIQQHYMLQLDTAVFDIKDATLLKKVGSCTDCQKRTGANRNLFNDIDHADTCTDPGCFDKKKEAHFTAVAKAAEAKGQKVIQGKEARELMPHSWSEPKGYKLLDTKEYVDGRSVSVRSLIGKENLPAPVIIINPHTNEAQEALPTEVAGKLISKGKRARTVAKNATAKDANAKGKPLTEEQLREQYDERWQKAAIAQLHAKLATDGAAAVGEKARVQLLRVLAARFATASDVYGPMADQVAELLKVGKVGWQYGFEEYFEKCDQAAIAPALMLFMVADQLVDQRDALASPVVKVISDDTGLDVKAIQAQVKAEMKAEAAQRAADAKAKVQPDAAKPAAKGSKAPKKPQTTEAEARSGIADALQTAVKAAKAPKATTPKGTAGKKGTPSFMQDLVPSAELAAVIGDKARPRTEIVSALWAYVKKHKLQDTTNKRMVNADDKLRPVFDGKAQVSMFEMAGMLGRHVSNAAKAGAAKPAAPGKKVAGRGKVTKDASAAASTIIDAQAAWPFPIKKADPVTGAAA